MSTSSRRDYIHAASSTASAKSPSANLARDSRRGRRRGGRGVRLRHRFRHADRPPSAPWRRSANSGSPITSGSTTGSTPTPPGRCFKHSCGSVERFIPSFIEAGFDILNPVQCSATGMERRTSEVRLRRPARLLGRRRGHAEDAALRHAGGGAASRCSSAAKSSPAAADSFSTRIHNVQAETPVANIVAMLDAVHEFNGVADMPDLSSCTTRS